MFWLSPHEVLARNPSLGTLRMGIGPVNTPWCFRRHEIQGQAWRGLKAGGDRMSTSGPNGHRPGSGTHTLGLLA
jgi:hypothetical protein